MKKITVLSDESSWINFYIPELLRELEKTDSVRWIHTVEEVQNGDIAFLLGCGQIISKERLSMHQHNLVVHESDLPQGKGWSPLTWQILEGKKEVAITLFEAASSVDSGVIYAQQKMRFWGHELIDELRLTQWSHTKSLCLNFVRQYEQHILAARKQEGESSFYPRRTAKDSLLDPQKTLLEQFSLLRVVDNERYPAFFEHLGHKYIIKIEKEIK